MFICARQTHRDNSLVLFITATFEAHSVQFEISISLLLKYLHVSLRLDPSNNVFRLAGTKLSCLQPRKIKCPEKYTIPVASVIGYPQKQHMGLGPPLVCSNIPVFLCVLELKSWGNIWHGPYLLIKADYTGEFASTHNTKSGQKPAEYGCWWRATV